MLTRFELHVILRTQVEDRRVVRRALAVEAIMEDLAAALGEDVETWAQAGLGAHLDADFVARNPERRGQVAEEILLTEGASAEVAAAVRQRVRLPVERLGRVAATLVVAEALAAAIDAAIDADVDAGDAPVSLDAVEPALVARRLVRAATVREDAGARRALACLERLGLAPGAAAGLAHAALLRVRADLRR